jgi:hypothetical protein
MYIDNREYYLSDVCNYQITNNDKDRIKTSELYNKYISDGNPKLSMVKFSEYVKQNDIETIKSDGYMYFKKIKIIEDIL